MSKYEAIIAKNSRNKEIHTLLWEKGNTPKRLAVLGWFVKLFGGGIKGWKIISRKGYTRYKDVAV